MDNIRVDTAFIEGIEQQLEELRSSFSNAAQVLKELEEIQIQFEDLCNIYAQLKEDVSEVSRVKAESNVIIKSIEDKHHQFEQCFAKLSETNQLKLEGLNDTLNEIRNKLSNHHSQIHELHQNLAEKLPLFQEYQSCLRTLEHNLNDVTNSFDSKFSRFQAYADKKLGHFGEYTRSQDKQMRILRNLIIALFILWLCLAAFVLVK
jgi:chromosome segregation ATPase